MSKGFSNAPTILIVEDVEETRDCIENLLEGDGYRVEAARDEETAVASARRTAPDLILVSLSGVSDSTVIDTARRIRARAGLGDEVTVVIFCVETLNEGAEIAVGDNVHVTRPDNFDQLRKFIKRLLHNISVVA